MNSRNFLSLILDSIYWGHSLIEVCIKEADTFNFEYELVPRKNVRPIQKIVLKNQTDTTGIPYNTGEYNLIECGDSYNLGLLCNASPFVIYKRNCLGDFAQYTELFGQPIREGIYSGYDENSRATLKRDMEETGSSAIWIHSEDTQIKFIDSISKSGSADLYQTFIHLCNSEISKLFLGNTLTTEVGNGGGNRALGEVMYEVEKQFIEADKAMVLNILNTQYIQLLQKLGIKIDGEFVFVEQINLKERIDLDIKINSIVPIEPQYFADTYGVPLKSEVESDKTNKDKSNDNPPKEKEQDKNLIFKALTNIFS